MATEASSKQPTSEYPIDCTGEQQPVDHVVDALADHSNVSPAEVKPVLYDTVDPDVLNQLLGLQPSGVVIEFDWNGHTTRVHDGGELVITEE